MDKKSKNTLIVSIIALALVLIGVTYAYFSARITGLESASMIQLTAGRMGIVYSEGDGDVIFNNIYPREEAWVTKTFTLTGYNSTDQAMKYNIGLNVTTNTFPSNYLTYDLRLISSDSGMPIASKSGAVINGIGFVNFGKGTFFQSNGDVHAYELKIYFKDNGLDQNDAQQAVFNAKIDVREYEQTNLAANIPLQPVQGDLVSFDIDTQNCTDYMNGYGGFSAADITTFCSGDTITYPYDGTPIALGTNNNFISIAEAIDYEIIYNEQFETVDGIPVGYEIEIGPYIYHYKQSYYRDLEWEGWEDQYGNGWGVGLNSDYTGSITEAPYVYIDDIPVIYMDYMFANILNTSINLSGFDTSNVVSMSHMFEGSVATSLDLRAFDTSNVTNMQEMFDGSTATSINVSSFDTSKVRYFSAMFNGVNLSSLDLSNFDTSSAINMDSMFSQIDFNSLDLTNFDTSHVKSMSSMFSGSQFSYLNLSSFDTSSVTSMRSMFQDFSVSDLNLSSFNTSNVTYMESMFSRAEIANLTWGTHFDTSNVENMGDMFSYSNIANLDLSHFNTSNVRDMSNMFRSTLFEVLDVSSFNTSNVKNMNSMFRDCPNLTTIYASNSFVTTALLSDNTFSGSTNMFKDSTNLVGGNGTTYNASYVNKGRARIDASGTPGYFTLRTN